ncbi:MAG: formylglycine-generating enzyme family protein [Bacteroidales bacterium]
MRTHCIRAFFLILFPGVLILFQAILVPPVLSQDPARLSELFPETASITGEHHPVLFSVRVNGIRIHSDEFSPGPDGNFLHQDLQLEASVPGMEKGPGYTCRTLALKNLSADTLEIENLLPLGPSGNRPYITGHGPPGLARATLFLPDRGPVGLIVPDNAWEMGFTVAKISPGSGLALLSRRDSWKGAERRRYSTLLHPGGEVRYRIYTEKYAGDPMAGLVRVFRDRWLYDLEQFDDHLYQREDLRWIREDYLAVLQFAWDQDFYSREKASYEPFREFFHRYDPLHGGYDIYAIWQGWPRLGLDHRNQWDLFRDLPGGTDSLRSISGYCKDHGAAFFISYNPWDQDTRRADHLEEMSVIIRETAADGVVLDTRGSSSLELQAAADRARPGVVMYSEGMAVPRDMPGIISGRVHNAIRMSPPLNLNRLIKPGFQVFRVLDLRDGRIRREMAISLFNGYGAELNLFSPAHPWWLEEDYRFMGQCLMILRQNRKAFHGPRWDPLAGIADSIWVNRWHHGEKTLYTLLSLKPGGHHGPLFMADTSSEDDPGMHWVSLWDHEEIEPVTTPEGRQLVYHVDPFNPAFSGTRAGGSVQCIAGFPELLSWRMTCDSLVVQTAAGDRITLWKGDPSYSGIHHKSFLPGPRGEIRVPLSEWMHLPEGKIVVQLFEEEELMDEQIIRTTPATPVRISETRHTGPAPGVPENMVKVTGGDFRFYRGNDADFIPYPHNFDTVRVRVDDFYMDRYPVTNRQFREFLEITGYFPEDTANFLKHWNRGSFPDSLAGHPVVWISLEDARAYAHWKGKRLPAEIEWQYAAQGTDGRKWPWGNTFDSTLCNHAAGHTTPVDAFPEGRSPFWVEDLVGNVWQLCDDEYFNGSFRFSMIRGGSFFRPTSSWWYIAGGPRPNDHTQMLLRTAPGFDRCATVGFRCVCDQ